MKVVLLAGNGGSGGLKGYIRGFIFACRIRSDDKVYVICTEEFAEYIKDASRENNVSIIAIQESRMGIKPIVFGNRLPKKAVAAIDGIAPDVVLYMNSIIHKGTEKYFNAVGFHNQLYIDTAQLKRQKLGKTRLTLSVLRHFSLKSLKKADLAIFDSEQSLRQTIENKVFVKNSAVAYFGIEKAERAENCKDTAKLNNPVKLIYVSTLFPYKNQLELLDGISELKKRNYAFRLDLVGSGPKKYVDNVKSKIISDNLEDYVKLHDWVDHNKIKDMIDSSDIFIYASSIETSGFGLMEGMARGVPIACNNQSCLPEILKDSGVVFDVFSKNDVADKIQSLIDDKILRQSVAKKAFDVSLEYTWENCVSKIFNAFEKILKKQHEGE